MIFLSYLQSAVYNYKNDCIDLCVGQKMFIFVKKMGRGGQNVMTVLFIRENVDNGRPLIEKCPIGSPGKIPNIFITMHMNMAVLIHKNNEIG